MDDRNRSIRLNLILSIAATVLIVCPLRAQAQRLPLPGTSPRRPTASTADWYARAMQEATPATVPTWSAERPVATAAARWTAIDTPPPPQPTIDLDSVYDESTASGDFCTDWGACHVLPDGLIYKAYLAGVKESRMAAHLIGIEGDNTFLDGTLGGRFGVARIGTTDALWPEGVQFDVEGAAHVRLDIPDEVDVRSVDFRAGGILTFGDRWRQTKFGYYHLSSHVGDEFLIKHPAHLRLNYARDVLVLGHSIYLNEMVRVYGEIGWSFFEDVSEQWEFQFGMEYAPARPTGSRGAPFFAFNGHLREEVNFGGSITVQTGWAWRGDANGRLMRLGLHYYNGESSQFSFYDDFEQQIGCGLWFDY